MSESLAPAASYKIDMLEVSKIVPVELARKSTDRVKNLPTKMT